MKLSTNRLLEIEIFFHNGQHLFRTREIASVLGIKQQFEFVADIKRMFGHSAVKNGVDTVDYRSVYEDSSRTTFITADILKDYLKSGASHHKIIPIQREKLLRELRLY